MTHCQTQAGVQGGETIVETNWQSTAWILAPRVCALGPQPGITAGILNLLRLNAVPFVCTSGLSMSIDVLETDELNMILREDWVKQAPLRLCGDMGYLWKTAVLPCRST